MFRNLGAVERLTPFQCVVLDKSEGVLTGDLYESRRYADDTDMQVFFCHSGLATSRPQVFPVDRGCTRAMSLRVLVALLLCWKPALWTWCLCGTNSVRTCIMRP